MHNIKIVICQTFFVTSCQKKCVLFFSVICYLYYNSKYLIFSETQCSHLQNGRIMFSLKDFCEDPIKKSERNSFANCNWNVRYLYYEGTYYSPPQIKTNLSKHFQICDADYILNAGRKHQISMKENHICWKMLKQKHHLFNKLAHAEDRMVKR